jgi:hypothetical protein
MIQLGDYGLLRIFPIKIWILCCSKLNFLLFLNYIFGCMALLLLVFVSLGMDQMEESASNSSSVVVC